MSYEKPEILAENQGQGSFAAGCPERVGSGGDGCGSSCSGSCEIRQ